MKPYGVKKKDKGCCGGHDKYSTTGRGEDRKKLKRRLRPAKKRARQKNKCSCDTDYCEIHGSTP